MSNLNLVRSKEEQSAIDIRSCLAVLDLPASVEHEAILGRAAGNEGWKALLEFVRIPSEILLRELTPYWKVVKGYLEGKYQRVRVLRSHSKRKQI